MLNENLLKIFNSRNKIILQARKEVNMKKIFSFFRKKKNVAKLSMLENGKDASKTLASSQCAGMCRCV
jgi:hypothetical protein